MDNSRGTLSPGFIIKPAGFPEHQRMDNTIELPAVPGSIFRSTKYLPGKPSAVERPVRRACFIAEFFADTAQAFTARGSSII